MKMFERLAAVPERIYVMLFFGIFLVTAFSAYFLREDTALLEKRIAAQRRNLAEVIQLRDIYETKKHGIGGRASDKKPDYQHLSLGLVEGLVAKSFVGGTLASLQPSTNKEGKASRQVRVDVKVAGAALGEVVTFVKAAEDSGIGIEKLQLSLPASNPTALDMQATLFERRSHG